MSCEAIFTFPSWQSGRGILASEVLIIFGEARQAIQLTSNTPMSSWDELFTGDDALLRTLDRLFDRKSVVVTKGSSFRVAKLEIFPVESSPMAIKKSK